MQSYYRVVDAGQFHLKKARLCATASSGSCVCVSAGSSLHIQLNQETCIFHFDCEVVAVACWRGEDSSYFVGVAEQSGSVHVLSLAIKALLHSYKVFDGLLSDSEFTSVRHVSVVPDVISLAVLVSGALHIVSFGDDDRIELPKMVTVDLTQIHCLVLTFTEVYISNSVYLLTGGTGQCPLALWKLQRDSPLLFSQMSSTLLQNGAVTQAVVTAGNKYAVTLTNQGVVQVWLLQVMALLGVWEGRECQQHTVQNISLLSRQPFQNHHLCVMCSSSEEKEVKLLSVPKLETVFSRSLSLTSIMVTSSPPMESTFLLMEESSVSAADTRIKVERLECGTPQDRVTELVGKGRFEEAEQLVKYHDLDPEQLVQEKKLIVVNKMVSDGDGDRLQTLLQYLKETKDIDTAVNLILGTTYPSLDTTYTVLCTLCSKIAGSGHSSYEAVTSSLRKLTTFSITTPDGSGHNWQSFRVASCLQLIIGWLNSDQLPHALLFWARHKDEIERELTNLDTLSLIQFLPSHLQDLSSWLTATLLPFLTTHRPYHMKDFLFELSSFLCSSERNATDDWPSSVLTVIDHLLISLAKFGLRCRPPLDISPLTCLQQKLVMWVSMSPLLRCNLTYQSYDKLSPTQLVYQAMDQTSDAEQLSQLLAGPIPEFAELCQLDMDILLTDYLKFLLTKAATDSQDFKDSPWEANVVAIVNNISNTEMRVASCQQMLHSIGSSWGSAVTSLVNNCLLTNAPNVQQLRDLYELLQMQIVLRTKYGISNFNYSDSSTGDIYIKKILAKKKSAGLADAVWVALKYGVEQSRVYVRHLYSLCCEQKVEEAQEIITSLPPSTLSSVSAAAITFSLTHLHLPFLAGSTQPKSYCGAIQLALLVSPHSPTHRNELLTHISLKHLLQLAMEFSIFLTPSQLSSRSYTAQLLHEFLERCNPVPLLSSRAMRLGLLLGYSEQEVYCMLIKLRLQQHSHPLPLHLLEKCPTNLTLPLLHSVLTDSISVSLPLVQELTNLAGHITTSCGPGQLRVAISSFRACSLLLHLLKTQYISKEESCVWPWAARVPEQGLLLKNNSSFLKLPSIFLQHRHSSHSTLVSEVMDVLETNGHLELALHTAVELLHCLCCQLYYMEPTTAIHSLFSSLLEKVLSMSKVDHSYGLTLLLALPPKTSLHLLQAKQAIILPSYSRVIAMCRLAIDYCVISGPYLQVRDAASSLMTGAVWAKILRTHGINFSSAFRGGTEEKTRVLSDIVCLRSVSPQLVLAYCRTYRIDGPGALLTRLRLVLRSWDTGYQEEFRATRTLIRNNHFILTLLQTFLTTKVCPYDYNRIKFVLREVRLRSDNHSKLELLLSALEAYGERKPPTEEEIQWHSSFCHGVCCKKLSSSRLPLHVFLDHALGLRIIIREASSISTANRLISIAQLMEFPENDLYSTVLKSLKVSELSYSQLSLLLSGVTDSSSRLLLTINLADHISGKNCVTALEEAIELARDSESDVYSDLEGKLRQARTKCLLEEAGLTSHTDFDSASSIISTVYSELPLSTDPPPAAKVHNVAQMVAEIHDLNILALSSDLLQEWLLPNEIISRDLNTTMVRELQETVHTDHTCSVENWKRMIYLLTDNPYIHHLATVLYNCAKSESQAVPLSTRLLALDLLQVAIPPTTVLEVAHVDSVSDLRDIVYEAAFVVELGSLQVALTTESFRALNKTTLVYCLLQTRADCPKALQLAADLSVYYQLIDTELWDNLLKSLLHLKMEANLQNLLPKIGPHPYVKTISSVWKIVIESNYEKGVGSDCLSSLSLLHQCPVLYQLDLPAIIHTMTSSGAHSHALSASLLLPPSQSRSTIEVVLDTVPPDQLLQLLDTLVASTHPELFPRHLVDLVYDYIDKREYHECLLGTSHFPYMVNYLIAHHQISSLLSAIRSRGRETEALQLAELYCNTHNIPMPASGTVDSMCE